MKVSQELFTCLLTFTVGFCLFLIAFSLFFSVPPYVGSPSGLRQTAKSEPELSALGLTLDPVALSAFLAAPKDEFGNSQRQQLLSGAANPVAQKNMTFPLVPKSRVFMFYLPLVQELYVQIDELFAATESWRFTFGIPEDPNLEPQIPTSKLSLSPSLPHLSASPADDPAGSGSSAPVVNDLLIVADPRIKEEHLPSFCQVLWGTDGNAAVASQVQTRLSSPTAHKARCFILKDYLPSTQFSDFWSLHPAMNSVAALAVRSVTQFVMQYDLMLRSDNDCFLTPALLRPENIPWRKKTPKPSGSASEEPNEKFDLFVGGGGYNSEDVNAILPEYSAILGLRHQGVRGIGSSWYGRPIDLVNIARLTLRIGGFLLTADPVISRNHGEWPKWYRGVTLLYSAEMAINHLVDADLIHVKRAVLDTLSTSRENIFSSSVLHIHCWHTPELFSKLVFRSGKYNSTMFEDPSYDIKQGKWYSFTNAWNGRERRIAQENKAAIESLENTKAASFPSPLVEKILSDHFFKCPESHARPFAQGKFCCKADAYVEPAAKTKEEPVAEGGNPTVSVITTEEELKNECPEQSRKQCLIPPCAPYVGPPTDDSDPHAEDECPAGHPYPYLNGSTCCRYDQDCNGDDIDLSSECCRDHQYIKCTYTGACKPHPSVHANLRIMRTYGFATEQTPMEDQWLDLGDSVRVREKEARVRELIAHSRPLQRLRKRLATLGFSQR